MRILVITILMVANATINCLFAQETRDTKKVQRISLGYNTGYSYFFDNRDKPSQFISKDNLYATPLLNFCFFGKIKIINSHLKFQFYSITEAYPTTINKTPTGAVINRWVFIYELNYIKKLLHLNKTSLNWKCGLISRFGQESMIAGYYQGWEIQVVGFTHRDAGVSLGMEYERNIYKNFKFNAFTDMTYFACRYHDGTTTNYSWDNGTTKWMYRFMIGLSYDVWTRKSYQKI